MATGSPVASEEPPDQADRETLDDSLVTAGTRISRVLGIRCLITAVPRSSGS